MYLFGIYVFIDRWEICIDSAKWLSEPKTVEEELKVWAPMPREVIEVRGRKDQTSGKLELMTVITVSAGGWERLGRSAEGGEKGLTGCDRSGWLKGLKGAPAGCRLTVTAFWPMLIGCW